MNIRLRRHTDATSATSTSFNSSEQSRPTTNGSTWSRRSAASNPSTHLPAAMNATRPSSSEAGSRTRINKKGYRTRSYTRRNTSSNYTYTASPFSCRLPTNQHQRSPPSEGISGRCRSLLSTLRWKIHLLKFDLLLQLGRLRNWLSAKFPASHNLSRWLKVNVLRKKPEPRRPFFPRNLSSYDAAQQQQAATTTSRSGINVSGGEEKKGRIRRLSQSTMKSLKKACSLNSERDELREADRRAMERLDELWRSRET